METHTQTDDTQNSRAILEGQLRECYGRVVYSHKTQEKCADILLKRQSWIKIVQIALSAIATGGCIATVLGESNAGAAFAAVVSTVLLALNAYTKDFDLGELAQKHRQAGADLWLIREKYLNLITDLRMGEKPIEALQGTRDELLQALHATYSGAPSTTFDAYQKAQEALKTLEDMTFSDTEIDAFLPRELRRTGQVVKPPLATAPAKQQVDQAPGQDLKAP